jgi:hypothetical protein
VELRKFDRALLADGDAVGDLADFVGLPRSDLTILRTNEGIGLEAVALLYAIRRAGYGAGGADLSATTLSIWLAETLDVLSTAKFRLAPSVLSELVQHNAQDLAWMETRLGASLYEPDGEQTGLRSEAELLEIARAITPEIAHMQFDPPPDDAAFLQEFPTITPRLLTDWVAEGLNR